MRQHRELRISLLVTTIPMQCRRFSLWIWSRICYGPGDYVWNRKVNR